jgi:hypothetical protein
MEGGDGARAQLLLATEELIKARREAMQGLGQRPESSTDATILKRVISENSCFL